MCIHGCRETHCDAEAGGMMGVGPVHTLASTCLQKVEEQPEDADNQRNVTRMSSQPSDPGTTVHAPATLTGPAGETTAFPSEYLPMPAEQQPLCRSNNLSLLPPGGCYGASMPLRIVLSAGESLLLSVCVP